MNSKILQYLYQNRNSKSVLLGLPQFVYVETDIYVIEDAIQWLGHVSSIQKNIQMKLMNINKIGDQQGLKITNQLANIVNISSLDLNFQDSLIAEMWFFKTLALLLYGMPYLKSLRLNAHLNQLGKSAKKNDQDYEIIYALDRQINDEKIKQTSALLNHDQKEPDSSLEEEQKEQQVEKYQSPIETLHIDLSQNELNDIFLLILSKYLKPLQKLSDLDIDLGNNEISDTALKLLLESTVKKQKFRNFSLRLNNIPELTYNSLQKSIDIIAHNIGSMKALELSLGNFKIGIRGSDLLRDLFAPIEIEAVKKSIEEQEEEYISEQEVEEEFENERDIEIESTEEVEIEEEIIQVEAQQNLPQQEQQSEDLIQLDLDEDEGEEYANKFVIGGNSLSFVRRQLFQEEEEKEPPMPLIKPQRIRKTVQRPSKRIQTIKEVKKRLKIIQVKKKRMVEKEIKQIVKEKVFHKIQQLQLNLQNSGLGDKGIEKLSGAITGLEGIGYLDLNLEKCQISEEGVTILIILLQLFLGLNSAYQSRITLGIRGSQLKFTNKQSGVQWHVTTSQLEVR